MKFSSPYQLTERSAQIPCVLELIRQEFSYMESRIDPPSSMYRLTVESLREKCSSGEVWAIGEQPYACVFLTEKADCLYVGKLAVRSDQRGQGCARKLIELAERRAQSRALAFLELETRIELHENHETFHRLGFVKIGEGAHAGFDRSTYIVMRKPVCPQQTVA